MIRSALLIIPLTGFATACAAPPPVMPDVSQRLTEELVRVGASGVPPAPANGVCWAADTTPARIETVTEQVEVSPARIGPGGTVLRAASYRTETRQRIVRPREEVWFRTPCASEMTPELVATLQRALKARRDYKGPITGVMDTPTREALRRYQAMRGLDSALLSLAAARQLGLVAVAPG